MRVISALKLDAEHAWCDAAGKCFLDMLGLFAEFETNLRRERISRGSPRPRLRALFRRFRVDHFVVVVGDLLMQALRGVGEEITMRPGWPSLFDVVAVAISGARGERVH
jgi:hypothetical protein